MGAARHALAILDSLLHALSEPAAPLPMPWLAIYGGIYICIVSKQFIYLAAICDKRLWKQLDFRTGNCV